MILSCPSCPKTYDVPAAALPPGGRDVECSACGTVWFERGPIASAVRAGAAGADVVYEAPMGSGPASSFSARSASVIDADYVTVTEETTSGPPRPGPAVAGGDARPAPSPARTQQQALTIAYPADADTVAADIDADAARRAASVLYNVVRQRLRRSRERLLMGAGVVLGTGLHVLARLRRARRPAAPVPPGHAAARASRARMRARAANALTPGRLFGWLVWTGTFAAVCYAVTAERGAVVRAFAPAGNLYALVAPIEPPPGLVVAADLKAYANSSKGPAVMVTGVVRNDGRRPQVPIVSVTTVTPGAEEVQTLPLPRVALPPGGERPFAVRALVPADAVRVRVAVAAPAAPSVPEEGFALQEMGSRWSGAANGHAGPPALDGARAADER